MKAANNSSDCASMIHWCFVLV